MKIRRIPFHSAKRSRPYVYIKGWFRSVPGGNELWCNISSFVSPGSLLDALFDLLVREKIRRKLSNIFHSHDFIRDIAWKNYKKICDYIRGIR